MIVRVKLFAAARELAGSDEVFVEVRLPATISDIQSAILLAYPALKTILPHCLWAVDASYACGSHAIAETSEIALIPPVSGG
jgi:molybdopterin converting factor small subunit